MSDALPPISLFIDDHGAPVAIVDGDPVSDPAEVVRRAPALATEQWVRAYARVANHLAGGGEYEMITDPAAFREEYMARYEAEDPDEQVAPGEVRLHNYALPDFDRIHPPAYIDGNVVFFVRDTFLGIPYVAVMAPGETPDYTPVPGDRP